MKMNNFNIGMPFPNMILNNNFTQKYKNFVFKDDLGISITMQLQNGTTISKMIEKYCLKKQISDPTKFYFIYNNIKIDPYNNTTIDKYFADCDIPLIIVKDENNLIGG